jgi:uncharacterized protein with HEPN domain
MSKADPQRLKEYLQHILQAIQRIERYTEDIDEVAFLASEEKQDAVIRNIEILGEAARNIERHYPDFAAQHADVSWTDIYLMRNRVAHGYFSVDLEVVWKTIQRDLPELAAQVSALLDAMPKQP